MSQHRFEMEWPPSVNSYWRHPNKGPLAGRTLVSEEGRKYRAWCIATARSQEWPTYATTARLGVTIEAFPPDRRRRDIDNVLKAALDGLTHAGVWGDDEQVDRLQIIRKVPVQGGALGITVEVLSS